MQAAGKDSKSSKPVPVQGTQATGNKKLWKQYREAAKKAVGRNDFKEADKQFAAAIREAEGFNPKDYYMVQTLDEAGEFYVNVRSFSKAEQLYTQAADLWGKAKGTNDLGVGYFLGKLGDVCVFKENYSAAEAAFSLAQGILEKKLGAFHRTVGFCMSRRAHVLLARGKHAEAEPLFKKALEIIESPEYKTTLTAQGDLQQWVREPKPQEIASILNDLSFLYKAQNQFAEAETALKKSLKLLEHEYGKNSPVLATGLGNLAAVHFKAKQYDQAETCLKQALALAKKSAGMEHPFVRENLASLGEVYYAKGNLPEVESTLKLMVSMDQGRPVQKGLAVSLVDNLTEESRQNGQWAKVEQVQRLYLKAMEQVYGSEAAQLVPILNGLAKLCRFQKNDAETAALENRAQAISARTGGKLPN